MEYRLDHVHYKCSDHERTVAFFREMFGATEVTRFVAGGMPVVTLEINGQRFNFSPRKPGEVVPEGKEPPHWGVYHIALRVDDIEEATRILKARGVGFTQDPKVLDEKTKYAFLEGPDGIAIELLERR